MRAYTKAIMIVMTAVVLLIAPPLNASNYGELIFRRTNISIGIFFFEIILRQE